MLSTIRGATWITAPGVCNCLTGWLFYLVPETNCYCISLLAAIVLSPVTRWYRLRVRAMGRDSRCVNATCQWEMLRMWYTVIRLNCYLWLDSYVTMTFGIRHSHVYKLRPRHYPYHNYSTLHQITSTTTMNNDAFFEKQFSRINDTFTYACRQGAHQRRDGGSESALRTRREERSEGVLVQPATASDCTRGHTHHVLRVRDCVLRQTRLAAWRDDSRWRVIGRITAERQFVLAVVCLLVQNKRFFSEPTILYKGHVATIAVMNHIERLKALTFVFTTMVWIYQLTFT